MTYEFDLSVILPVYNVEKYIASCLDLLLKQTFTGRLQVILVEDKSSDKSLEVCRHYADQYAHITLIEHAVNGGSATARNTGLQESRGEYFIFVDPDDLLPEEAFDTLYRHIKDSDADIVKGSNTTFRTGGQHKKVTYGVSRIENYYDDDCLMVLLKHEKLRGHPWGKIFRASQFETERFTPEYKMAQDLLYCTELFAKASHVKLIPDVVYQYRIHSEGATGKKYETGAYLSWLKCVSEIQKFVTTKLQKKAYLELKIRTLTQISREVRSLSKGVEVAKVIEVTEKNWLPTLTQLIFKDRVSLRSLMRYLKFRSAMRVINTRK